MIGGSAVDASIHPEAGALVEWTPAGPALLVCTATVVAPRAVLTAAHCVATPGSALPDFTLLSDVDHATHATTVRSRRAYVHPAFDPTASTALHDLAIVELDEPVDAPAARFSEPSDAGAIAIGDPVELVGYGLTTVTGDPPHSKNAGSSHVAAVAATEFTVGGPNDEQACIGDSGGPVYDTSPAGSALLIGVTSRSADDRSECVAGSVSTRIDAHAQWIESQIDALDAEGPSAGCDVASKGRRSSGAVLAILGVALLSRRRRARQYLS